MRPRDCKTERDVLTLRRDNYDTKEGWILCQPDNLVVIQQQRTGENAIGCVELPRGEFNRMVDWWNRNQKPES